MHFEVEFYETEPGSSPALEFLDSLEPKVRAKFVSLLELLESNGNRLRKPYSEHIDDEIFELRCKQGSNIYRIMYFFYRNRRNTPCFSYGDIRRWAVLARCQRCPR